MDQTSHSRIQRINLLALKILALFRRYLATEPMAIPPTSPLVPRSQSKPSVISKSRQVKGYACKLCSELSLGSLKMNLLVLIMQLIVMSENISVRATSVRSDSPNKLTNLKNSICSKLIELHTKFAKNVQEHGVRRYAKASSKEILKNNYLVLIRGWNKFYVGWSGRSLKE
jgi:hypothetical protein